MSRYWIGLHKNIICLRLIYAFDSWARLYSSLSSLSHSGNSSSYAAPCTLLRRRRLLNTYTRSLACEGSTLLRFLLWMKCELQHLWRLDHRDNTSNWDLSFCPEHQQAGRLQRHDSTLDPSLSSKRVQTWLRRCHDWTGLCHLTTAVTVVYDGFPGSYGVTRGTYSGRITPWQSNTTNFCVSMGPEARIG